MLEFKMIRSKQTFSFNPPIKLVEEGKWLLRVTSSECTNSVSNETNENNSLSISIPGHYQTAFADKTIDDQRKVKEPKSPELHVKKVRKRGNKIKIGENDYNLSDSKEWYTWWIKKCKIQWSWIFSLKNATNFWWN